MHTPDYLGDTIAGTLAANRGRLVAGTAGAGGVSLGINRSLADRRAHPDEEHDPLLASAAGTGLLTAGIGAGLYAARRSLVPATKAFATAGYTATKAAGKTAWGAVHGAWKAPGPVKAVGLLGLIAGGAVAAKAFAHEDPAAEDHTVNDGMGGYEAVSGVRERARAMNARGDLVFGLNARRH